MKFAKVILEPSYLRKWEFDSVISSDNLFLFDCVCCCESIALSYQSLIGKDWIWKEKFDPATRTEFEEHFKMNLVGKTLDGFWTAIDECECEQCGATYLIYGGVNEYAHSPTGLRYKVFLK